MGDIYEEDGKQYALCEYCGEPVELEEDECVEVGGVQHIRHAERIIETFFMHETCWEKKWEQIDIMLEDIRLYISEEGEKDGIKKPE